MSQAVAALGAALALASCGGDEGDPIPEAQATRLESLLQQVQRQSDAGSCTTLLEDTIPALEQRADDLPESVSSDTRETITDGIDHLRGLAETDCTEQEEQETTPEETTPEETTAPETTRPEETTTTTRPEEEPPPEEEQPPEEEPPPEEEQPPEEEPNPGNGGTPPGLGGGTPPGQRRQGGRGRQAERDGNGDDGGGDR